MEFYELNNGVKIPQFGLGCGGIYRKKDILSADSIRLFKTYCQTIKKNEIFLFDSEGVGYHEKLLGMANKIVNKRERMFITTKLSNAAQRKKDIRGALENSLRKLNTDYVDLYLMHWPQTDTYIDSYLEMEKLYKEGKARAIGVCNFHIQHLETLGKYAEIPPAVNQIEIHPLFSQVELVEYCKVRNILPMSYTPLARMHDVLVNSTPVREISEKHNASKAAVIIRWHIQRGLCPIPKTTKYSRVEQYIKVLDFCLTDSEMNMLNGLNDNVRLRYNPEKCDFSRL